jgi:hypothetical protein
MKKPRHLSWNNFKSSVLVTGEQRVHRISSSPLVEVFSDGISGRIGIWLESATVVAVSEKARRLAFVSIQTVKRDEKLFLEISSLSPMIHRQFYVFVTAVADRVLELNQSISEALDLELESFAALLEEKALLSIERQLGLIGELIVLERMITADGPQAIDAWIGPRGEPHDFRVARNEFEVKTTAASRRVHTIHNFTQLIVSPNCILFIVSVLLGPAGRDSGFSLAKKIDSIRSLLGGSRSRENEFHVHLESYGGVAHDYSQYDRSFDLRRPLAVIPVDSFFPAIVPSSLKSILGEEAHRVDHIVYDVNVEGLESEEGTKLYSEVFPWPSLR